MPSIDKVTIFAIREKHGQEQLLILGHPLAGLQLPAGTVEPSEASDQAALRELAEESGLHVATLKADRRVSKLSFADCSIITPLEQDSMQRLVSDKKTLDCKKSEVTNSALKKLCAQE